MADKKFKDKLTPEQYRVMIEKGTEAPFTGKYVHKEKDGTYACAVCGQELFSSDAQFESNEAGLKGWPSFDKAIPGAIKFQKDDSLGMKRTEVVCSKCGSHLGHIFDAPDSKTGKHYCINSVCLDLKTKNGNK